MHRSTTTAALLVTVTLSALSGCMTVAGSAVPGSPPDTAPSRPSAPRPDGSGRPRVVQAPAREALELAGPSQPQQPAAPAAPDRAAGAPPQANRQPPAPPRARSYPNSPRRSHVGVPDFAQPGAKAPDVCAIGKQYGGWGVGSPESLICGQAYGH
ncbi:lipoprotein [Streptomyces lucensis JCM 4490]|uniref:Lipoprotein n=1 Tax=Streptomyces lucensis JCM 4490 TaxID=1306176 RepID=A0A918J3B2_9ACTN|nr:hypothetical protein [Streptomyces lucensis]GGW44956.1 lipoprotein [Streptomyces lucensis JCM 4490]